MSYNYNRRYYKKKSSAGKWFKYTLIIAIVGILVFSLYSIFTYRSDTGKLDITTIPGQVTIADPTQVLNPNANGGLNGSYIDKQELDPNCPVAEDKYFNMQLVEYKDAVIYDINKDGIIYNVVFYKTDAGLIFDGCLNVKIEHTVSPRLFLGFIPVGFDFTYSFSNIMSSTGNNFTPIKDSIRSKFDMSGVDHYYSIASKPSLNKLVGFNWGDFAAELAKLANFDEVYCYQLASLGCHEIFNDNFQQLGPIGIKMYKNTFISDFYTFYNMLYKSTLEHKVDAMVDVTNYTGDVVDGVVYKSNRFININYKDYSNVNLYYKSEIPPVEYIKPVQPNTDIITKSYPYLTVTLNNKSVNETKNYDMNANPVVISFVNEETKYVYKFTFTSIDDLTIKQSLPFGDYVYTIDSKVLDFSGYSGNITFDKEHSLFKFDFSYVGTTTSVKVRLMPLSDFDMTNFRIGNTPVTITLTNKSTNEVSNFVFNTDNVLNTGIAKVLDIGEYTYYITSDELSFSLTAGEISVTRYNYNFDFYYDYKAELVLNVRSNSVADSGAYSAIYPNAINFGYGLDDTLPFAPKNGMITAIEMTMICDGEDGQQITICDSYSASLISGSEAYFDFSNNQIFKSLDNPESAYIQLYIYYDCAGASQVAITSLCEVKLYYNDAGELWTHIEPYK